MTFYKVAEVYELQQNGSRKNVVVQVRRDLNIRQHFAVLQFFTADHVLFFRYFALSEIIIHNTNCSFRTGSKYWGYTDRRGAALH